MKLVLFLLATSVSCAWATDLDNVLRRIEFLEKTDIEQLATVSELKQKVDTQDQRIQVLEETIEVKDDIIKQLVERIEYLERPAAEREDEWECGTSVKVEETQGLEADSPAQPTNVKLPTQESRPLATGRRQSSKTSTRIHKRLLGQISTVAFHAVCRIGTVENVAAGDTVIFDDVKLNVGDGYHDAIGVFIAPRAGLYLFSVSVTSENSEGKYYIDTAVVKGGDVLGYTKSRGSTHNADQGSITVPVVLQEGEEVWVKVIWPSQTAIRGENGYTSFMGVLVSSV